MDNIEELYEELENLGLETTLSQLQLEEALVQGTKSKLFQDLVYLIAFEIHQLGKTEEEVRKDTEFNEFMLELSAFLKELCCPYSNFIAGPLSDRFKTKAERILLLNYLATECMSLKICFKLQPDEHSYVIPKFESTTARALETITKELNLGKPPQNITAQSLFQKINTSLTEFLRKTNPVKLGKPLLNNSKKLTDTQWNQLYKIYNTLNEEYMLRREMLLTRLEVTVQSFQWSDKIKKNDDKIVNRYQQKLSEITSNSSNESDISDLLAARSDLAIIEKTSNASVRKNTFCKLQKHIIGLVPDRGGRANEHAPPPPEMPSWQTQRTGGPSGGGRGGFQNNRGGGFQNNNQGRGGGSGYQGGNRGDHGGGRGGFQGNQGRDFNYQTVGRGGGGGQNFGYETPSNNNFQPQYNEKQQFNHRSNTGRVQGGWNPGQRNDNWNSVDKNPNLNNDSRGHGRGGNFSRGRSNYNRGGSQN